MRQAAADREGLKADRQAVRHGRNCISLCRCFCSARIEWLAVESGGQPL